MPSLRQGPLHEDGHPRPGLRFLVDNGLPHRLILRLQPAFPLLHPRQCPSPQPEFFGTRDPAPCRGPRPHHPHRGQRLRPPCRGPAMNQTPDPPLREKHPGPLRVIWNNAPAHRGEAVREYLRTAGLGLRLVNPRLHGGRLCRATARTSTPMRPSGGGRERRPPAMCAWGEGRRCGRGWANSWPDWPTGKTR